MFLGHYAVAFAAKKVNEKPSLGTLFLAAQWLDLLWPLLLLMGYESVKIEPGNTVFTPLNFVHYPISHSLLFALGWSVLFGLVYFFIIKNGKAALLIGALVFSHWVLDWITHRPDLPLSPFSDITTGLGLWNYKLASIFVELILFIGGVYLYFRSTKARNKTGKISVWILIVFLVTIYFLNIFGPLPVSVDSIAKAALSQWILIAWGYWIDYNRTAVARL